MGIYDPLTRHLKSLEVDVWNTSFAEIERIISRPLPDSAYQHRPWWANQKKGSHSQARSWRDAGWETGEVNLARKTLRFERKNSPNCAVAHDAEGSPLEPLWNTASTLTGIDDRTKLLELALREFVQAETGRQLASLGGSDPAASAAPRRNFW